MSFLQVLVLFVVVAFGMVPPAFAQADTEPATATSATAALLKSEAQVFERMKGRPDGAKRSGKNARPRQQYRDLNTFAADIDIKATSAASADFPTVPKKASTAADHSLETRTIVVPEAAPGGTEPGVAEVRRYDYELGRSFTTIIDANTGEPLAIEENAGLGAPLSRAEIARAVTIARAANPEFDKIVSAAGEGNYHVVALLNSSAGQPKSRRVSLWIDRPRLSPRLTVDLVAGSVVKR